MREEKRREEATSFYFIPIEKYGGMGMSRVGGVQGGGCRWGTNICLATWQPLKGLVDLSMTLMVLNYG